MEIKREFKKQPEKHIHSPAHALADELAVKFSDTKHFGFYLRMALKYDHNFLRRLAGEVIEQKAKKPGALFAFLIKKHNDENRHDSESNPI
ncbi:MAG: hypothetical protein A3I07_00010 [Candidatus Doudnabacteria bacterium RIFCSPLOWO2_02_FULL_42_9]|uniref:Uncharacterized protein n=1 Tax=Candidatus Doudnabacteria bacterium RIFCSPHIGHO2_01_FULL_41_86 TaxID=1817821 RepID=A0A1F5N8W3_9BACT|nr:MAG: hypothetical protein A2717_04530 [Candidatus Doudnabacteria bacterium RIFCSPHIGHO2_01_FULL_41_86]OGE75879.1 MAG: hypothetical protein A3K07_04125 [Candidatus Doudnabacteria bacterium RIFCSPHIGHO2_01_43_10]OGE86253.1 MAG: hypothetical protein A3E28_03885 [Candidatus Doudnabacteria bacterium RIFCSPHIGHO2_12_FULL_42_22]OGE87101.1 MAG: hypothetical protein A3C49_03550 [Candidatus Doudnabacteria bacterium RIFCSPHIGHO2_02_FULL_42_25]OGE92241.1 MAG: hypothetical protein A2895_04235 [Candidatus